MAITFKDVFDDISSKEFGIRRNHAEKAISKSDAVEVFEVDGLRVIFYTKWIETESDKYLLLVQANEDGKNISVNFAIKLYPELLDINLHGASPLEIFENFIEHYGAEFSIGNFTGKYVLDKKIPVTSKNTTELINVRSGEKEMAILSFIKISSVGIKYEAQCALVFCFKYKEYGDWLRSNKH
ncbi:hypothetical protein NST41_15580 [Paenibacillus sp. FSL L8-0696]|uniref:hypothetical protein n=1 Tax=Paenibacillus sp. FSL L8-0696 TaxID=2954524 RepID=UPI00311A0DE6